MTLLVFYKAPNAKKHTYKHIGYLPLEDDMIQKAFAKENNPKSLSFYILEVNHNWTDDPEFQKELFEDPSDNNIDLKRYTVPERLITIKKAGN